MDLVLIGYSVAALAYIGLAAILISARRFAWPFNYLLVSALLLAGWAIAQAATADTRVTFNGMIAVDAVHAFAILLFMGQIIQRGDPSGWRRWFGLAPWALIPIAGAIYWQSRGDSELDFPAAFYFIVAVSVAGLLAAEQIIRNAGPVKRRVAALLAFSFGAVFVFDLFIYANAILVGGLDTQLWAARGFVNALVVPIILVALKRDPDWQTGFFVSRQVVFYSASLIGVGLYMLLVAFGGALMQQMGGEWGAALRALFFVASMLLLVLVLFSQQLRRRLKVFLTTHFYANRYDYREEWLKLIRRLAQDSQRAPMPELCLDALMDIIDSDGGVLWLRGTGADDDFLKAANLGEALPVPDLPTAHHLLDFMRSTGWIVDGREAHTTPEHYRNAFNTATDPVVTEDRLFVPFTLDGELIGVASLLRPVGMPDMNFEDHDLLRTVGQQLAVFLQRDRNKEQLAEAREFEVFNRFTAFIMHDLKNLIAQQSLVVENAEKHKSNPAFVDDAINTIANSVTRMNKLLAQLQSDRGQAMRRPVGLSTLLEQVTTEMAMRPPAPTLSIVDDVEVSADPERLSAVLGHLVRNAQEATDGAGGQVVITLTSTDSQAVIDIVDDGTGMDATFIREQLFKPFESTKGAKGMGIGAYQARDYVEQLGGSLRVKSSPGEGSHFTIELPCI